MTRLDTIDIDGLIWADKHEWTGIAASESRAATGALIVQVGAMSKGRPITLTGGQTCWLAQGKLNQLQTLAAKGLPFTLVRGEFSANVMFRYSDHPVIETSSLWERDDTENQGSDEIQFILKTIKLIEV